MLKMILFTEKTLDVCLIIHESKLVLTKKGKNCLKHFMIHSNNELRGCVVFFVTLHYPWIPSLFYNLHFDSLAFLRQWSPLHLLFSYSLRLLTLSITSFRTTSHNCGDWWKIWIQNIVVVCYVLKISYLA